MAIKPNPFKHKEHPVYKYRYYSYNLISGYLLLEKAKKGDPLAEHELAIRYILGMGFPKDTTKAVYWMERAVKKNLVSACFNYAIMLNNGIGVEWNPFTAYKLIKFAAESGMAQAQFALGIIYTENLIVAKNLDKAYKWLKLSEKNGHKEAKKVLQAMIEKGYSPPAENDFLLSSKQSGRNKVFNDKILNDGWEFDLLDFNADKKDSKSKNINEILKEDKKTVAKSLGVDESKIDSLDNKKIINYAAENGSPEALLLAAKLVEDKDNDKIITVEKYLTALRLGSSKAVKEIVNYAKDKGFIEILRKEVKKNNPHANYVVASLSALGFYPFISQEEAIKKLEKSSEQNNIPAMLELGLLYSKGGIVKVDTAKAVELFKKAESLGNKEASIRLIFLKLLSKKNQPELIKKLKKYEKDGAILASTVLGFCYLKGLSTEKDKAKAADYFRKAASRGNEAAFNTLKKMYDDIRPAESEFTIY